MSVCGRANTPNAPASLVLNSILFRIGAGLTAWEEFRRIGHQPCRSARAGRTIIEFCCAAGWVSTFLATGTHTCVTHTAIRSRERDQRTRPRTHGEGPKKRRQQAGQQGKRL